MIAVQIGLAIVAVAFVLSLLRVAIGPSVADRAVAADVGYLEFVSVIALYGLLADTDVFVDVVLVATLVGFVAVIGFAWMIERRGRP